jgi:hypothetical protein
MDKDKLSNNTGNNFNNYNHDRRDFIKYLGLLAISVPTLSSCDYLFGTTLSSECQPISGGTINPSSGNYDKDVVVEIIAIPSAGYRFDHWEGSVSGQSSAISLTMDKSKNVIAYFIKTYKLNVSTNPSSGGTVVPSSSTYDEGENVTLIASASHYYSFSGWGGDISGSSNNITIMMNSDKNIIATFIKNTFTLQTIVGTSGGGTITPISGNFEAGSTINVVASPNDGYRFNRWDISDSTSNTISILMDSNKIITGYFIKIYQFNTNVSPSGSGIVNISPNQNQFDEGSRVSVTATSVFPYAFHNWVGTDNDYDNPATITMNSNKDITAIFATTIKGDEQNFSGNLSNGEFNKHPTDTVSINLQKYEWVQGIVVLAAGSPIVITIQDPNGTILDTFTTTTNFTFQAQTTGRFIITFSNRSIFWYTWELIYSIYHLQ